MIYWPRKESILWLWLRLSAPNGKQNGLPRCALNKCTVKRGYYSLAHCKELSSFAAGSCCFSALLARLLIVRISSLLQSG